MEIGKSISCLIFLSSVLCIANTAKINTPRVLLPWFENKVVNFTFEIHDAGCYTWSLSRDDIIDLEPLYEGTWDRCSRAARVSVSKTCAPPGSVIILAEEVNSGEIIRGDVDVDKISSLEVMSTTRTVYLEEAPEAFEVVAYDERDNKFSTLEGISFDWTIENLGNNVGEELLITVWSIPVEYIQVSTSGFARVGRPHHLHVALTAAHPTTGELYNFHRCNCASFAVSLLEGPEPHNVTAATWVDPVDTFKGRSSGGDYATFSLEEWLNRTVYS